MREKERERGERGRERQSESERELQKGSYARTQKSPASPHTKMRPLVGHTFSTITCCIVRTFRSTPSCKRKKAEKDKPHCQEGADVSTSVCVCVRACVCVCVCVCVWRERERERERARARALVCVCVCLEESQDVRRRIGVKVTIIISAVILITCSRICRAFEHYRPCIRQHTSAYVSIRRIPAHALHLKPHSLSI